jgi:hypothetical protein
MNKPNLAIASLAGALFIVSCGEGDRRQAEAGAEWLQERRLFRRVGDIGEITKVRAESAELIRMVVEVSDPKRADAIDSQSLMRQSLIAKYACPGKGSNLWPIIGDAVTLRVDFMIGERNIASAICANP